MQNPRKGGRHRKSKAEQDLGPPFSLLNPKRKGKKGAGDFNHLAAYVAGVGYETGLATPNEIERSAYRDQGSPHTCAVPVSIGHRSHPHGQFALVLDRRAAKNGPPSQVRPWRERIFVVWGLALRKYS